MREIILLTLIGCAETPTTTVAARSSHELHYGVVEVPANLGGTNSRANSIASDGSIAGFSNLAGNQARHAALWRDGALTDLGTLGGDNSNVAWPGQNERGLIAGIAETADVDPNGEEWSCSAFFPAVTHHVCRGVVWRGTTATAMPTFGGTNSFAAGVNDRGQVVGWAETAVHDPTCNAPQVLQFRAALWEPRTGSISELPPLDGDATSAATQISDDGIAIGISGACDVAVGRFSASHAMRWDHGVAVKLPDLGGVSWHTPMAINTHGDIVGFSNPPGDADGSLISHAVLWPQSGGIIDLGTLPGDDFAEALGINARGQVVGISCGANGCHAFVWHDGVMSDLDSLVGPGFPDTLVGAQDIDDAGVITGRVKSGARTLPFVATPVE